MKKYSLFLLLAAGLLSFTVVMSIFDQLSVSEKDAKAKMVETMGRGIFYNGYELVKKARTLSVEEQVAGTHELIRFAKDYSRTEEFKKEYSKWRAEQLGYKPKKKKLGISNPMKMLDKMVDKQLNKGEDEKKLPSDPAVLIRSRLEQFLEVSATVDFDAELNGRRFANPAYEAKSQYWKMCFRAGREVIQAAREEAQTWLQELDQ